MPATIIVSPQGAYSKTWVAGEWLIPIPAGTFYLKFLEILAEYLYQKPTASPGTLDSKKEAAFH